MILDVGCGSRPRGDVNIDLSHLVFAKQHDTIAYPNMLGSALSLPFKKDSFDAVHFHGLLHHLSDARQGWKELVRVARVMIVGVEPWKGNVKAWFDPFHVYHGFTKRQLISILHDKRLSHFDVAYHATSNPFLINLQVYAFKAVKETVVEDDRNAYPFQYDV